jgi:hypothetical protein
MSIKTIALLSLLSISITAKSVLAEENLWVYAKGSDTRPQGSVELKASDIYRKGKAASDYDFHDLRFEAEYGITDRLTIGAEVIYFDHNYEVFDEQIEPYIETQGGLGSRYNKSQLGGYEVSMKYNFLSPYKDAIGLSVGLGYEKRDQYRLDGADIDQDSYVVTTFIQKNFLDDTLSLVLMPKLEFEKRRSPGVFEEELSVDIAAGISYRIKPKWFAGLEFRHQSDYLNPREDGEFDPELDRTEFSLSDLTLKIGSQHQRGNYFGPTVHYASERWWATAGALYQFAGGGRAPGINNSDGRNWDEQERWHFGLSFGWEFGKEDSHEQSTF